MDRPAFDMVVIDESHHAAADTYLKVIDAVKEDNPDAEIVRLYRYAQQRRWKRVAKKYSLTVRTRSITTLIREGFLVPPKSYVIDCGVNDSLRNVAISGNDFNMEQVESIMNRKVINQKVVEEYLNHAEGRKTVVFCSTIKHAEDLLEEFLDQDINAEMVTGGNPKAERAQTLHDLAHGDVEVVVNVSVLTEGFDAPPVSCIILTRPCSQKATMVQMIGRGLRTVDPEEYPNLGVKGLHCSRLRTSILTHGSLEDAVNLEDKQKGEAPLKQCPECKAVVPMSAKLCPICGHVFVAKKKKKKSFIRLK